MGTTVEIELEEDVARALEKRYDYDSFVESMLRERFDMPDDGTTYTNGNASFFDFLESAYGFCRQMISKVSSNLPRALRYDYTFYAFAEFLFWWSIAFITSFLGSKTLAILFAVFGILRLSYWLWKDSKTKKEGNANA